jgi:hypothetical protein
MPAPRTLAPTSVGAPMRLTVVMDALSVLQLGGIVDPTLRTGAIATGCIKDPMAGIDPQNEPQQGEKRCWQ